MTSRTEEGEEEKLLVGVLALQGAFEEHQTCLEAVGCNTKQVRTPTDLEGLDGLVLPGGESTAMGLIGTGGGNGKQNMWSALQEFSARKPTWGTCAGMILLAERCVGASAVIEDGQALVGGMDMLVCRNYFGSQVSSFEMPTKFFDDPNPFPGVFIRAPAILSVNQADQATAKDGSSGIQVLAKVVATPCRQAAVVLHELEQKLAKGEQVVVMGVVDALDRTEDETSHQQHIDFKQVTTNNSNTSTKPSLVLPGAANGTNAREVICAVKRNNLLCTAFHPELTDDYRWHQYFVDMVQDHAKKEQKEQK
ncbi:5'-phosphate synthase subunit PdxT [Seminavis robusta]|uniref:glutaminase n=1 Tax=Seminavis robusta TaxID=568900 RepID=A0A9N8H447_9STRA|nr:5'-phosphate synthase subunit PdxT [Seminavis robusta]|eukprot:Sro76_g041640.1 5'-phosphate synthase subunit PdxT (308) ;mRNA; f:62837-63848